MTSTSDDTPPVELYGAPGDIVRWLARPLQALGTTDGERLITLLSDALASQTANDYARWRQEARAYAYRRYLDRFFNTKE